MSTENETTYPDGTPWELSGDFERASTDPIDGAMGFVVLLTVFTVLMGSVAWLVF